MVEEEEEEEEAMIEEENSEDTPEQDRVRPPPAPRGSPPSPLPPPPPPSPNLPPPQTLLAPQDQLRDLFDSNILGIEVSLGGRGGEGKGSPGEEGPQRRPFPPTLWGGGCLTDASPPPRTPERGSPERFGLLFIVVASPNPGGAPGAPVFVNK